jgi:hypothetical protein
VFAELQGAGDSLGGIADFVDPPTLDLSLPKGANVTTASGLFHNFPTPSVPEPSTWAMMLLGFGGLGFAGCRASRARKRDGVANQRKRDGRNGIA